MAYSAVTVQGGDFRLRVSSNDTLRPVAMTIE
jgi:hypothetical protein